MAIQTNITLTAPQNEYFQRFVNLSVNEEPLPQGDGVIRISPYDDYFLFTLYDEIDGEDTPIDLSNVGNIYINFIGTSDEINIKNHTQVEEVDLSQGEVLFKISKSDSKKVFALDNNNFYISTKMIDETDGSISDESVLYQGQWLGFDVANKVTLTAQLKDTQIKYSIELAELQAQRKLAEQALSTSTQTNAELLLTVQALQTSNLELSDQVAELSADLSSTTISAINANASAAQAMADAQQATNQQLIALANSSSSTIQSKSFFQQAANNLQNFTTSNNAVSQASSSAGSNSSFPGGHGAIDNAGI